MKLSPEQSPVVKHASGHLQVVACAGSGKTEAIAQRVAGLLADQGFLPAGIVAFTFTKRAARELKARITKRVAEQKGVVEVFLVTLGGSRENQTLVAYLAVKGVATRAWPAHRFELGLAFDSEVDQRRVQFLLREFATIPPDLNKLCRQAHPESVPPVG